MRFIRPLLIYIDLTILDRPLVTFLKLQLRDRHEIYFIFEVMVITTESQRLSKYITVKTLIRKVLSDGISARLSLDLKIINIGTLTVSQSLSSREQILIPINMVGWSGTMAEHDN